ncbi:MAG: DEAD/DEAH box helicase [Nitrososphaeria archaeon]|nr:DEAD/DEAH box helicase [Nitrososphaeria archaeon]NIN52912.1 DEAD/DEAH box helicase [Nitrososphaeria archaeon]NIQ33471.1 DEAD/DEAH box helicase [Nitrososphaeria archaeon]
MSGVFTPLVEEIKIQLSQMGLVQPTEIQRVAIPVVLSGSDALIVSSTGMGKTEAALLPIFHNIIKAQDRKPITSLYITPLRALNRDIFKRMKAFGEQLGMNVQIRHSDTPRKEKRAQVENPPEILITTPETLGIILNVKSISPRLKNVRHVVVDEYHELMESKRGVQLSLLLERLKKTTRGKIQIIGLSATIGDCPTALKGLLGNNTGGRVMEAASERESKVSIVYAPREEGGESSEAEEALANHIKETGKTLVFTNTRGQAEALSLKLKMGSSGLRIGVHHGSLSASIREEIEAAFNEDRLDAVICTSSMELGVDITGVKSVVQWSSPRRITKLAQRIGRSEHKPEMPARGLVFARSIDDFFESLAAIKLLRTSEIERPVLHKNSLDVLAHQIIGMALNESGISIDEIYETVNQSYFYSSLELRELEEMVGFLVDLGLLAVRGGRCYPRRGSIQYYFENVSTIPEVVSYRMRDVLERRNIATLDESFVGEYCDRNSKILVNGETWRVVKVDEEEMRVHAARDNFDAAVIPQWVGELLLVDKSVANKASELQGDWVASKGNSEEAIDERVIGGRALDELRATVKTLLETHGRLPGVGNVMISMKKGEKANLLILHVHEGDRVDETLAQLMRAMIKATHGFELNYASSPYRVIFLDKSRIVSLESMIDIMKRLSDFRDKVEDMLEVESVRQGKFLWILWNVCKRMGAVKRGTRYKKRLALDLHRYLKNKPPVKEAINELFTRYYDVEAAKTFLEGIHRGDIPLYSEPLSPWSRLEMEYILGNETPAYREFIEEREALELLKQRVRDSRVRLLCLNCGTKLGPYTVKRLEERKLRCIICGASLLGVFWPSEHGHRLAQKIKQRKKLSDEERREMERVKASARLISYSGVRALFCLQAYGVGIETAKRILRYGSSDEEALFKRILEAQRKYFETRMYWE